jgi:aryl-alcohol dehydrogenase-like predicted oxidoreductase
MDHRKPHPEFYDMAFTTEEYNGMPYRYLGRSGLRVSNVGLGTWKIGYPETGDGARVDEKTALNILDRAVDLGVTFWDTANRYNASSGNSERVIGTWMQQNPDQRRNVVLATKVFGLMDGRTPNHCRLSRGSILDSVYASLERLQVDYVDLLYFHAFDPITPVEESLSAVEDLVHRDLVRYFAVSNYTPEQLSIYRAAEEKAGIRCRVLAVQNQFDILQGEVYMPADVLAYAARSGISFVAWSPLARGLLTERYLDLEAVGPGDRLYDEGALEGLATEETLAKLRQLAALAQEWGCELSQLAIAYMLTLPGMGPVIASASSVEQLASNAAAGKMVLADEQILQVKAILGGPASST